MDPLEKEAGTMSLHVNNLFHFHPKEIILIESLQTEKCQLSHPLPRSHMRSHHKFRLGVLVKIRGWPFHVRTLEQGTKLLSMAVEVLLE